MGKKKTENLKQDFIDMALVLFAEIGYEDTSINLITKKLGVSKGAFYHYFSSKEEILESISAEYVRETIMIIEKVAGDHNLNAIEKLNSIIVELINFKRESRIKRSNIIASFNSGNNLKLKQKIFDYTLVKASSIYSKIFQQGYKEGLMNNNQFYEVAELWVNMVMIMNESVSRICKLSGGINTNECQERIRNKVIFYQNAFERLLGVSSGLFKFSEIISGTLSDIYW